MMIKTSLISLLEAINKGRTLSKGQSVSIPIEGDSTIYGFIAVENLIFDLSINTLILGPTIDMPPLGEATVLSNRVICAFDKKIYRFPIFNSVCRANESKYRLYMLYVPRLMNLSVGWKVQAYKENMSKEIPNPKIAKIEGIELEDNVAYYNIRENDLFFRSSSKLSGISNGLAVIIRRISSISGDIKYEIYNPDEVKIENS